MALPVTVTAMQTANPILIKELYVGGCQKNDGSGKFAKDKCIILYNNSSEPVLQSLNRVQLYREQIHTPWFRFSQAW